jgi:hypothetical protein
MVPAPALHVPEEAVRRWHQLVERRAALRPSRCSCGCRCADSGSRAVSRVHATDRSNEPGWRRRT